MQALLNAQFATMLAKAAAEDAEAKKEAAAKALFVEEVVEAAKGWSI